jgi:hypothetical protein
MTYDPTLGYDDAMPDAFQKWIQNIDADAWLEHMEAYASDRLAHPLHKQTSEDYLWSHFAEHVFPFQGEPDEDQLRDR